MKDYRPSMDAWQKITDSLWYTHLYLRTFIPLLDANARKSIRDNSQWSWDSPQGCGPSGFALSQNYSSGILVNLGIYFLIPLGFEKKRKERERKEKGKRKKKGMRDASPNLPPPIFSGLLTPMHDTRILSSIFVGPCASCEMAGTLNWRLGTRFRCS